jgi:hypothetical protein
LKILSPSFIFLFVFTNLQRKTLDKNCKVGALLPSKFDIFFKEFRKKQKIAKDSEKPKKYFLDMITSFSVSFHTI